MDGALGRVGVWIARQDTRIPDRRDARAIDPHAPADERGKVAVGGRVLDAAARRPGQAGQSRRNLASV